MLISDCQTLVEKLRTIDRVREIERTHGALLERQQDIEEIKRSFDAVEASYQSLGRRVSVEGKLDGSKAVLHVRNLRQALERNPNGITEGRLFTNFKQSFGRLAEAIDKSTRDAWAKHRGKSEPRVDTEQVEYARQFPAYRQDVIRLSELDARARQASKAPPADEAAFERLETLWQQMRDLIAQLPLPNSDPEIAAFLRAANTASGADLALLTDKVKAWIQETSIGSKFRIHFA